MELSAVLNSLALSEDDPAAHELYARLKDPAGCPATPRDWLMLAAAVARSVMPGGSRATSRWPAWNAAPAPLVIGISGGQGSGKTTLARALERALELARARAVACSLDDFYLSRSRRRALAASVHPLLATRGVPGTHDVALLRQTIAELGGSGAVRLPVFDKGADDVLPVERWRTVRAPVDVLVLEGWCVGARAENPRTLEAPVNELEAVEDRDGTWRRYVNDALAGAYARLWERLQLLVYLQVPDMASVIRWRAEQEQALEPSARMSQSALARFIAHYERTTRAMLADLPGRADVVVCLGEDHRVTDVRLEMGA